MISYLSGSVVFVGKSKVTINVNGVGYGVHVSREDLDHIKLAQSLEVFIYEHIQEKAHDLYGFSSTDALNLFEDLISINGIGPKAGLAILDLGPVASIKQAIASGNNAYISGASGVGKKTAERVVVELRDKLGQDVLYEKATMGNSQGNDEALQALIALGYSSQQALQALANVDAEGTEARIRAALKELA
ncbi:TPA: Holliday junction branch migration protein RuvA [Candidatus Saccharibacteria bacterium]|nr:Holliday junction branch migration protein RuvA [Candidatus Saccharibacteria bacterium]HIO87971.1 Holliday junction branch migration protein RuvA [Candidatus Saccharibacteria bacterium]